MLQLLPLFHQQGQQLILGHPLHQQQLQAIQIVLLPAEMVLLNRCLIQELLMEQLPILLYQQPQDAQAMHLHT